jgi:hypothetical protein
MDIITCIKKTGGFFKRVQVMLIASLVVTAFLMVSPGIIVPAQADPPDNYAALEQVASFADKTNALKLMEKLENDGKVAFIVEKKVNEQIFYSVVFDKNPPNIVKSALKRKLAEKNRQEIKVDMKTISAVIPTMQNTPGPSVSLEGETVIYSSPSKDAVPLGTYASLGEAHIVNQKNNYYVMWLPLIERNGYIPVNEVPEAFYSPDEGESFVKSGNGDKQDISLATGTESILEPGEVLLPTLNGKAGKSIVIMKSAILYDPNPPYKKKVGTYSSLGDGSYVNSYKQYHAIWFEIKGRYALVPLPKARVILYTPETPENEG